MPASYGGALIFGTAVKMTNPHNPSADQENAFFGVSGMESLFGGTRGRVTLVKGLLYGVGPAGLAAVEGIFDSYLDGIARQLVTTLGVTYNNVKLASFVPTGKARQTPDGIAFREYEAKFQHMSYS